MMEVNICIFPQIVREHFQEWAKKTHLGPGLKNVAIKNLG
jgi:hypothetical protein